MDDQHRFDWLGCAGAGWLRTPNIDLLAQRGVHLTHCCTNAPICGPARVSLATGLLPRRTGAVNNDDFISRDDPTYYRRLRDAGYRVGCVGKLHLINTRYPHSSTGDRPILYSLGFTHPEEHEDKFGAVIQPEPTGIYTNHLARKNLFETLRDDYLERKRVGWPFANDDSVLPKEDFHDCWIGTRAVRWLEQINDDRPWHLFVSFNGPHDPFDPPTEYAERYRDAPMPPVIEGTLNNKPRWQQGKRSDISLETRVRSQRQYAALIELIDEQVGRLVEVLERRDMLDNTIVIFTSDHGEMLGDHGLWRKRFFYEQSLRVPLVMAGPGIEPGRTCEALIELSDLNPTMCELAGGPASRDMDARSFANVLRGQTAEHRDATVSQYGAMQCLRTRTHKMVHSLAWARNTGMPNEPELYDLENDPDELHNIAQQDGDTLHTLQKLLSERHFDFV